MGWLGWCSIIMSFCVFVYVGIVILFQVTVSTLDISLSNVDGKSS